MKLTWLVDNAVLHPMPFWSEHGLSVLVDTPEGRVLFGTGASGTVLLHNRNYRKLDTGGRGWAWMNTDFTVMNNLQEPPGPEDSRSGGETIWGLPR
jgi:hypothetical protein